MKVFTLLYVRRPEDGRYLMLKRGLETPIMPGKLIPTGGKVEPGETVEEAGKRELQEETGLVAKSIHSRGTYAYISTRPKNPAGTMHLLEVTSFEGQLVRHTHEGVLGWYSVEEFFADPTVDEDHKELLELIDRTNDIVAAYGDWRDGKLARWETSSAYYAQRRNAGVTR
jgi:8-oxo-dGTP pyrophosphatase MutT (NUDIX family)